MYLYVLSFSINLECFHFFLNIFLNIYSFYNNKIWFKKKNVLSSFLNFSSSQLGIRIARKRFLCYERQRFAKRVFIRRCFWISSKDLSVLHTFFLLKIPNAPSVLGENFDLPRNERFFHIKETSHHTLSFVFFLSLLFKISNQHLK